MTRQLVRLILHAEKALLSIVPTLSFLLIVAFILLLVAPLTPLVPDLCFAMLYFWAIHNPLLIPLSLIFTLGLLQDALSGVYMGTNPLIYTLSWIFLVDQRRFLFNKSFYMTWAIFAFMTLIISFIKWLLLKATNYETLDSFLFFLQVLMTIITAPLIFKICAFIDRKIS
jgi:rod shape-determining protein MreD